MKKSIHCTILSTIFLIGFPLLSIHTIINFGIKLIICGISIICFELYSPADTHKKPLINDINRYKLKVKSSIVLILYIFLIFVIKDKFLSNVINYSIIFQTILILPITYKLFNMPYKNYLNYR